MPDPEPSPEPEAVRLYAVYLGGDPAPGRLGEDHEVVMVVAPSVRLARQAARQKWGAATRPHVDAVQVVQVVDGYRITLVATGEPDSVEIDVTYEPPEA
ncbi:MAG: DUF1543 domain-containing protein [Acidimicrobiales bacterium]